MWCDARKVGRGRGHCKVKILPRTFSGGRIFQYGYVFGLVNKIEWIRVAIMDSIFSVECTCVGFFF